MDARRDGRIRTDNLLLPKRPGHSLSLERLPRSRFFPSRRRSYPLPRSQKVSSEIMPSQGENRRSWEKVTFRATESAAGNSRCATIQAFGQRPDLPERSKTIVTAFMHLKKVVRKKVDRSSKLCHDVSVQYMTILAGK